MNIETPKGWRKGQTLFNFLEWLLENGGHRNQAGERQADVFYVEDVWLDSKWKEFLKVYGGEVIK